MASKFDEIFIGVMKFLETVKGKILLSFSLKNLYVLFLLALWPAGFIYFEILDYDRNWAFLALGAISLSVFIISAFVLRKQQPKLSVFISLFLFGFLGVRLIELFLTGENLSSESEETVTFYFFAVFIFLLVYLLIRIFKENYSGKIIFVVAFVSSIAAVVLLTEISVIRSDNLDFQNQADRLFETVALYESLPPEGWKDYSNYDYNFFFKYPPRFSEDEVNNNLSVEAEKINDKIFNKSQIRTLESLKADYGDVKNSLLLIKFWQPECVQKLSNSYKNFILCKDGFNGEKIFFIQGDQLVKIAIGRFLSSEAEFNAIVNSFMIY